MSTRYDVTDEHAREAGLTAAAQSIQEGGLVVLPTDTVYGLGADAFSPDAVGRLLDAKGRGREMPPPVLVASRSTLNALAISVPSWVDTLVDELWPGPLTVVCRQQPSLQWDLGETRGTVAVRMPDDGIALELMARVGPMAVSSANRTGHPPALDADEAEDMLSDSVDVILDAGAARGTVPSTIVDATAGEPRVLRLGAIGIDRLNQLLAAHDLAVAEPTEGDRE